MDAILRDLTAAQREAVTHIDGPLLILAGPGSGKTRVVTHRIAHMIGHGIPAWQITALTFTNKAAEEMRGRVERLVPGQPVWMGTFHRFCARLLRRYASLVGLSENYSIYDTNDSKQALRRAIEAAQVNTSHTSPEQIAAVISRFKNRLVLPEMLEGQALRAADHVAARVYPVYQQQLLTANAVDFDDLLLHVARMLRDNSELRADLDSRHRYILVDEYQDTNLAQYAIVRALSVDHPNLSVTGDPDQSIYGWRGADINNILDFEKDYPSVLTVRLEENYRSTPEIVHVADTLIRHNTRRKSKDLFTHNPAGEPVTLRSYNDGYEEADDIAEQIASGVDEGRFRPRDVAVFCRMNALTRTLEHAFRARGVPYQIVNGVEFYQRKEIKDLLAYLHLINNPSHDVALQRVINTPPRGIGAKTIERLRRHADARRVPLIQAAREAGLVDSMAPRSAAKVAAFVSLYDRLCVKATASLQDLLRYLLAETGYQEYLEKTSVDDSDHNPLANVDELISAAVEFDQQFPEEGPLEAFLEQVALVSDTDAWEESNDRVTLMTLHAAKGLEFPRVYIIAVENDLLPHARSQEDPAQLEEERRLLFVGITRAEQHLQISYARRRTMRGQLRPAAPSHFLIELPRATMRMAETPDPADFDRGGNLADPYANDPGYPDEWDLPSEAASSEHDEDFCQLPDEERGGAVRESNSAPLSAGMTTAADLLSRQRQSPMAAGFFRNGMAVSHPEYGDGRIVDLTGRGPKRTAKVIFAAGHTQTFRLAFAPLTPAEH